MHFDLGKYSYQTINSKSITSVFLTFLTVTTTLFIILILGVSLPKISETFDAARIEADKTKAKIFSGQLSQYLFARELALRDLSQHTFITRTASLADSENPGFRDFIHHAQLLGEDPDITVIDALGDILYSELENHTYSKNNKWILNLLRDPHKEQPQSNIEISSEEKRFHLAVPIIYGSSVQGVLIASICADPEKMFFFQDESDRKIAVSFEKNNQRISSESLNIQYTHKESIELERYEISLTLTSDLISTYEQKRSIFTHLVLATILGACIVVSILFFFGSRIIVRPFQALAATQKAISQAVEGISYVNTSGEYTVVNEAYAKTIGYLPDELYGKHWSTTVFPKDIKEVERAFDTMLREGKVSIETRGVRKNGEVFYKRITMVSEVDENKKFVGHHCFMQDISESKRVEEEIRKHQRDLKLIFDHVPVKIWYKDKNDTILRLNKTAADSMGGQIEDFEGKNIYDFFPRRAEEKRSQDLSVISSNEPMLNIVEEHTHRDGSISWSSADKIPYTDPVTKEEFLFICCQDITALKEYEAEKNAIIQELSYINNELEQFAYIASHDLKSPLKGIEQVCGWIKEDCVDILPETSVEHIDLMVARIQRMAQLLDDLLAYAHVNRIDLSQEDVDLKHTLSDILDLHAAPFGFTYTVDAPIEHVLIARKPLEIIIRNLIDNAVKHHHKPKGHISIEYQEKESSHVIHVRDDGPGIPPDSHTKAFQMFQTLHTRSEVTGSGMGLAITKKILDRYDGRITIESDGISGTTFTIDWPFV